MAVFNHSKSEIDAKIVYCGPAISGKTTNLNFIHQHLRPDQRGDMISLATNEDRTLFFDFLPIELESVLGYKTRFHLYSVPGQIYYGTTRRAVLTGADALVFVADSHTDRMKDNLVSLKDLEENLRYHGKKIETIPIVFQYNKRDLPDVLGIEKMNQEINPMNNPYIESIAILGKGVFETLTMACRLVLKIIQDGADFYKASAMAGRPLRPGSALESQRTKLISQPKSFPPKKEGTLESPSLLEKNVDPIKSPDPVLKPSGPIALNGQDTNIPVESSQGEHITRLGNGEIEEGEKDPSIAAVNRTVKKKRKELSFKSFKERSQKASLVNRKLRILSCGEPCISSLCNLEIPLTISVEIDKENFPFSLKLLINLEQPAARRWSL